MISLVSERIATKCICCESDELHRNPAILMPFIAHRVFGWAPVKIDASWGLSTISDGMAYTLCHSLFCSNCECLFLDMRFSDKEMKNLYDGYRDEKYTALRESYEPGYRERNKKLLCGIQHLDEVESFLMPYISSPMVILDYGGDTGINTPFKNKASEIYIFDINEIDLDNHGLRVGKDTIKKYQYDLIVCSHVLEHVPNPFDILHKIKDVMTSKTILYLELPYEKLMQAIVQDKTAFLNKRHWHEHINFFSIPSITALLKSVGFKILRIETLLLKSDLTCCLQILCKIS